MSRKRKSGKLPLISATATTAGAGDRLEERFSKVEASLETCITGWNERDRRMEESDRAMRSYFTDELGKLREAIINELHIRAVQRVLPELLRIFNDLDDLLMRSEEAAKDESPARLWRVLGAYHRSFYNGLHRLGLEQINVVEKETIFDPHLHECVDTIEDEQFTGAEELPPGTIVKVRRKGYLFQKELFQVPQVIIKGGEKDGEVSQNHRD